MAIAENASIENNHEEPIWKPSPERVQDSHLAKFQQIIEEKFQQKFTSYEDIWHWSEEL